MHQHKNTASLYQILIATTINAVSMVPHL